MHQKPKIPKLRINLHSIPRYLKHSIPICSIASLLLLSILCINPILQTDTYAIDSGESDIGESSLTESKEKLDKTESDSETEVRDTLSEKEDDSENDDGLDEAKREDLALSELDNEVMSLADVTPSATLTIAPGSGGHGASQNAEVVAYSGAVAYRSHNVTVNASDITKYSLQITYANGNDGMYLSDDHNIKFNGAGGKTPTTMADNTWGFAWGNTGDIDSDMTYYTMPAYGTLGTNVGTGLLETNNTYSGTYTKKLVFAAKFGMMAKAGHYTASVLLSLAASPKEVTGTMAGLQYLQDMTTSICNSTTIGETGTLTDRRDSNTYTVAKLEDGKCWMTQNLRLTGDSLVAAANNNRVITSGDSDVTSSYTVPISESPWTSVSNDSQQLVHYANNATYGALYTWCVATAGSCSGTKSNTDAANSICPKGWRLPTGGYNSGEYYDLLMAAGVKTGYSDASTGLTKLVGSPYNLALAGRIYGGLNGVGSGGYYWTSTKASNNPYGLTLTNSNIEAAEGYMFPGNGQSVRCIAK